MASQTINDLLAAARARLDRLDPGAARAEAEQRRHSRSTIQAHREAASRRTGKVDLHDHRRRPGESLVDAQKDRRRHARGEWQDGPF